MDDTRSEQHRIHDGEKLFGNVRFSFETTNSAMMPIMQAQELAHPELMRKHPYGVQNVLMIPNEEVQFQSINVRDDTGQLHKIEGGSPLGTIIRGFRTPENRGVKGNAPALANSGNTPNLKVRLPNPDSIPGNIVVRSGFDPIQAYQSESMGSGECTTQTSTKPTPAIFSTTAWQGLGWLLRTRTTTGRESTQSPTIRN